MWGQGWRGQFPGVAKTSDGTIPHQLFLMLLQTVSVIEAGDQLRHAQGTALGIGMGLSGDDNQVQSAARGLATTAYPERFD